MNWSDKDLEKLFIVAKKYDFRNIEYNIDVNTPIVKEIFNEANIAGRDIRSILYQLANMNFFNSKRDSKKNGIFYRNDKIRFDDFRTSPNYKKMKDDEIEHLKNLVLEKTKNSYNLDDLISKISEHMSDRTAMNIKKCLFKLKIIYLNNKNEYCINEEFGFFKNSSQEENIKQLILDKKIPDELSKNINSIREDISKIYNPYTIDQPRIIFSNDGTGFGKSYGVFDQFISNIHTTKKHKNMFFITPLKSQIKIDDEQIKKAKEKNIEFLSYLSRADISNLYFTDWITNQPNIEKYRGWIKTNKEHNGALIRNELFKFDSIISSLQYIENKIENDKSIDFYELDELKNEKNKKETQIVEIIKEISLKIINLNSDKLSTLSIFEKANNKKDIYTLYADIIKTAFPIEYCKFKPCILLATTDKFDVKIPVLAQKIKSQEFKAIDKSFYELLGQKKDSDDEDISLAQYIDKNFENQSQFLKNDYFVADEDNYFRRNNISFHLIIDEEHDSYKKFFNAGKINLIDEDCKLEDVLASVYRLYLANENNNKEKNNYSMANEEGECFINCLNSLFKKYCDISNSTSIKQILKLFSNNTNGIAIDGNQIEHISNITKNIFNFSPKRFFNETGLKNISFRSHNNNTVCEVYTKIDKNDTNPTMYDIYQLIMVVLAACSTIKKNGKLHKSLGLRREKNHNTPLHMFINKATSVRKDVDYIFNRTDNEDLIVNYFFTYFQPKTIFSIEKRNDFTFIPESKGIIYIDFSMELRKELPETNIIKLLYNTNNSVVTLSATSGIKNNFTGNYNRNMLDKYSSKEALDYLLITRTLDDAKKLELLREKRALIRNVSIKEIEQNSPNITENLLDKNFQIVYKEWISKLKNYAPKGKYHLLEHKRQLQALLLSAYDGKNTLVLSLTNNFIKTMKKYLESNSGIMNKNIQILENNNFSIFNFKPFAEKPNLRVILFNSDLDKRVNVRSFTEIDDINTKLVFISSYNSAGTGLNYFVKYVSKTDKSLSLEEDFERLILINTPFYSEIKDKNGLNTVNNYITLLKYYSEEYNGIKYLKDFNTNLVNGDNYHILINEHNLAIFKVILQAIGRVERKDTKLESEIFIPSELIESSTLQFINLNKNGLNEIMINSMSLLNTNFMNYCLRKAKEQSFKSNEKRGHFENEIKCNFNDLKYFIDNVLLSNLRDYRDGITNDISLNEDLRHKDTIFNPEAAIKRLKNNKFIKDNNYEHIIKKMYIDTHQDNLQNIKLCLYKDDITTLTDLNNGFLLYEPYQMIIPHYNENVINNPESLPFYIFNPYYNVEQSYRYIPNPYLIPLLMGNMGEILFKDVLNQLEIKPLSISEMKNKISPELYELYDFYIEVNNKLICIDIKNWSNSFEKVELSLQMQVKAENKIQTIKNILKQKNINYDKVHFVYINTKIENNELNVQTEIDNNQNIYYLNLFKIYEEYKTNPDNVNKSYISKKVILNDILNKLLKLGDI